jgi:hypothetical protein
VKLGEVRVSEEQSVMNRQGDTDDDDDDDDDSDDNCG